MRPATFEDAEIVAEMVARLLTELSGTQFEKDAYRNVSEKLLRSGLSMVFLAMNDANRCVGMISVTESFAIYTGGPYGIIQELFVNPADRSSHIGHDLLHSVMEYGKKRLWNRIEVGAPNALKWERTIAFYRREGFTEIGPRLKLPLHQ